MTITATIVCDSVSPEGVRLTTFQLRYPRFIHAEELTHRILESQPELLFYEAVPDGLMYDQDLSRNASSSRAIPVKRMIEDLRRDPAMPIYWGKAQGGMQAGEDWHAPVLIPEVSMGREEAWLFAMDCCIKVAEGFAEAQYHKQIVNRLLEPWAHINVVVTAVSWQNFFALRSHPDAQPEIKMLSDLMQAAMAESEPSLVQHGQWHLPYILASDWEAIRAWRKTNRITRDEPSYQELAQYALMVSVARCARVSYKTHDGRDTDIMEDMALADKLIVATPLHASPAEHQATPDEWHDMGVASYGGPPSSDGAWSSPLLHGNLTGWKQYRKLLPNEFVEG